MTIVTETRERFLLAIAAQVPAERIAAVVQRQKLAPTSIVAVYDHHLNRVARSRLNPSLRPSPSFNARARSMRRLKKSS